MSEKGTQKTRIAYMELVRIIACFFVIINHTNSGIFMSQTPGGKTWWVSLCYFFMCKTAVPLFLMASGAVLLGRVDENEKHLKRILRIVADLVLFSLLMFWSFSSALSSRTCQMLTGICICTSESF